jgi:hypothetical protein
MVVLAAWVWSSERSSVDWSVDSFAGNLNTRNPERADLPKSETACLAFEPTLTCDTRLLALTMVGRDPVRAPRCVATTLQQ